MNFKRSALVLAAASCIAAVTYYTEAFSNTRLQWNQSETLLNATNVTSGRFRNLGSYTTADWVYAHPLYAPAVTVSGASHNLLVVADMGDNLYAFDADAVGSAYLWKTNVGAPIINTGTGFYGLNMGCMATPAIDSANNWLFEVCLNSTGANNFQLVKLNLSTGAIITQITVSATYPGTGGGGGDCTSGGNVVLCYGPASLARPGMTIANSNVYLCLGQSDSTPWHGWIIGYSESALSQVGAFLTTANGNGASVWQSGGAPAVDGGGNLYITTGNGDYDGSANFSMSVIKLSSTLSLLDWYTPSNYAALSSADADLGSGPPFIPATGYISFGMKDWNVYTIQSSCMGHLGGTVGGCTAPQIIPTPNQGVAASGTGIFGRMFMNGVGYFPTASGPMYGFTWTGSGFNSSALFTTVASYNTHGLMMAGSSNGASNGVVWGISPNSGNFTSAAAGTLRAFNATTGVELWNSGTVASDNLGLTPKFQVPLIANGRVYVGGDAFVTAFGVVGSALSGPATLTGPASAN
jgi:hypothetical protein